MKDGLFLRRGKPRGDSRISVLQTSAILKAMTRRTWFTAFVSGLAPRPQTARPASSGAPRNVTELESLERRMICDALKRCDGNQTRAARSLGMPRRTLAYRMRRYRVAV